MQNVHLQEEVVSVEVRESIISSSTKHQRLSRDVGQVRALFGGCNISSCILGAHFEVLVGEF